METNNILSTHKFDNFKFPKSKGNERSQRPRGKDNNSTEEKEPVSLSFEQLEGKCYCCGKPGHCSPNCHHKDKIPQEE